MRLTSAHKFAIGIVVVVVVVFAAGTLLHNARMGEETAAETKAEGAGSNTQPQVQVTLTPEGVHPYSVRVRGRTEAARTVSVRSETAGIVAATPAVEGAFVTSYVQLDVVVSPRVFVAVTWKGCVPIAEVSIAAPMATVPLHVASSPPELLQA